MVIVALIIGVITTYYATAFPVLEWDSLHYSAVITKYLFYHGSFPDVIGASLGFGMDTGYPPLHSAIGAYFMTFLNVDDDVYLRLLSPISLSLLAAAVYQIGNKLGGKTLAIISNLFVLTTPLLIYGSIQANYNLLLGAMIGISLLALFWAEEKRDNIFNWLMAGYFLGLASLISYNGYYPTVAIIGSAWIMYLITYFRHTGFNFRKIKLKPLIVMSVMAGALNFPWWIRNWIVFKTPAQPFLASLPWLQNFNPQRTQANITNLYLGVVKPLPNTMEWENWYQLFFWRTVGFPTVSWLALLGFVLLITQKNRKTLYLLIITFVYWLGPILQPAQSARHPLAYAAPMAIIASWPIYLVIKNLPNKFHQLITVIVIVFILIQNTTPVLAFGPMFNPFRAPSGRIDRRWAQNPRNRAPSIAIATRYHWHSSWQYINNHLKPDSKVAVTGDPPSYYIANGDAEKLLFLDSLEADPLRKMDDVDKIKNYLQKKKIQYIFWEIIHYNKYAYQDISLPKYLGSSHFPKVAPHVFAVGKQSGIE